MASPPQSPDTHSSRSRRLPDPAQANHLALRPALDAVSARPHPRSTAGGLNPPADARKASPTAPLSEPTALLAAGVGGEAATATRASGGAARVEPPGHFPPVPVPALASVAVVMGSDSTPSTAAAAAAAAAAGDRLPDAWPQDRRTFPPRARSLSPGLVRRSAGSSNARQGGGGVGGVGGLPGAGRRRDVLRNTQELFLASSSRPPLQVCVFVWPRICRRARAR